MKSFLITTGVIVATLLIGALSRFWLFSKDIYISERVLEMAVPLNVRIDEVLLKELVPAYEHE